MAREPDPPGQINLSRLVEFNRRWAAERVAEDPAYFTEREQTHRPSFLFIGCSDARVQLTTLTGVSPGEMFVHRNIANQVWPSDLNVQAVVQYAVDFLEVPHIIVCGHFGCGGIKAAAAHPEHGLVDHWLGGIRALSRIFREELDALPSDDARFNRLSELNVVQQIYRLAINPTVLDAWGRGQKVRLHGMVYNVRTGLLDVLAPGVGGVDDVARRFPQLTTIP